jgi:hypothetical protein
LIAGEINRVRTRKMTQSQRDELDSVELNPLHASNKDTHSPVAAEHHAVGGHGHHDVDVSLCLL